jgi:ribosomal protein L37E
MNKPEDVDRAPVHAVVRRLGDFDVWYEPCSHCGYDTGKSRKLKEPRCWKCGRPIRRDYSERALKPSIKAQG